MTAPTEAEIRDLVDPAYEDTGSLNIAGQLMDAFGNSTGVLDALYDVEDMRESERAALDATVYDAIKPIRDRAIAECREALIAAGVRFAAEHPDVPRAKPELVTA